MWRNSLDQLSNPFNSDGSRKTGDDLQTALELQAWNQFVFDNTDNQIDWKTFNNEVNELYAKVQSGEIPIQQFNNFLINNAQWAINPEVLR
jgi:hypothetical protein